jgi:hypothetical protein
VYLDTFLGIASYGLPIILAGVGVYVTIYTPAQQNKRLWTSSLIVFCVITLGAMFLQQHRTAKSASIDRQLAIEETTRKVSNSVADQYKGEISGLNTRIKSLQEQLTQQSRSVETIKGSNIITGRTPVKVEVTNALPAGSDQALTWHQGHLIVTQQQRISTRKEFPFRAQIVIQSDVEFKSLRLAVRCKEPIGDANIASDMVAFSVRWGISTDGKGWFYSYGSAGTPLSPERPITVNVYAASPITCNEVYAE